MPFLRRLSVSLYTFPMSANLLRTGTLVLVLQVLIACIPLGYACSKVASKVRGSSEPAPKVSPIDTCSNRRSIIIIQQQTRVSSIVLPVFLSQPYFSRNPTKAGQKKPSRISTLYYNPTKQGNFKSIIVKYRQNWLNYTTF